MSCSLALATDRFVADASHDVVIVGAGQAGLGLSYHLAKAGVDHVILDRGRIGNAWREDRWDSFSLVTPNWTITLPGAEYRGDDPNGFMLRDEFVDHLEQWAASFGAPVREGVTATKVTRDGSRFLIETDKGRYTARQVVVATATYQRSRFPGFLRALPADIQHLPASLYRDPSALPVGGVLVVGAGATGAQIAEELNVAGRDTYLAVGNSGRLPRRYRGRDCIEWQRAMGWLDRTPDMLEDPAIRFRGDPHLTGADGGRTLSLHQFHADGITLLGRLTGLDGARVKIAGDVVQAIAESDDYAASFRRAVDDHVLATGLVAPAPTPEEMLGEAAPGGTALALLRELDLRARKISTVISATGFSYDFSWVELPVFDTAGYPITRGGVTSVPGLAFIGLNWMTKRKSGIIYGVAEDAAYLAERITAFLAGTR